jgi:hypothetical protein
MPIAWIYGTSIFLGVALDKTAKLPMRLGGLAD